MPPSSTKERTDPPTPRPGSVDTDQNPQVGAHHASKSGEAVTTSRCLAHFEGRFVTPPCPSRFASKQSNPGMCVLLEGKSGKGHGAETNLHVLYLEGILAQCSHIHRKPQTIDQLHQLTARLVQGPTREANVDADDEDATTEALAETVEATATEPETQAGQDNELWEELVKQAFVHEVSSTRFRRRRREERIHETEAAVAQEA